MKMDYRRDLQHNYLVVETGEKTENYITRMMTENQVQGLLGCECRRMDQKKLYYYDITSKISLAEKSRLKKVKGSEVLLIIQGLLQVLVQLEEYLIPADQICLDWNYIYLDPVSCYPSFCCLPAAEKKLEQGIRELLEELLPRLDHQEQTGVSVVYELYQYAIQDTFSVMGLQSVLERRLMEERKTTETELQACQEKKSREHQVNGMTTRAAFSPSPWPSPQRGEGTVRARIFVGIPHPSRERVRRHHQEKRKITVAAVPARPTFSDWQNNNHPVR